MAVIPIELLGIDPDLLDTSGPVWEKKPIGWWATEHDLIRVAFWSDKWDGVLRWVSDEEAADMIRRDKTGPTRNAIPIW